MDNRISSEHEEVDGNEHTYWIDLAFGYILKGEWTHSIAGRNKREAYRLLKDVVPCKCAECGAEIK